MKIIRCLTEKIEEELHDADAYIDLAMKWKEEDESAADLFYDLSQEEMKHADMLHEKVAEKIRTYIAEEGEPPKGMQVLYEWMHDKHKKEAMRIKVKQGMFKE